MFDFDLKLIKLVNILYKRHTCLEILAFVFNLTWKFVSVELLNGSNNTTWTLDIFMFIYIFLYLVYVAKKFNLLWVFYSQFHVNSLVCWGLRTTGKCPESMAKGGFGTFRFSRRISLWYPYVVGTLKYRVSQARAPWFFRNFFNGNELTYEMHFFCCDHGRLMIHGPHMTIRLLSGGTWLDRIWPVAGVLSFHRPLIQRSTVDQCAMPSGDTQLYGISGSSTVIAYIVLLYMHTWRFANGVDASRMPVFLNS